MRQEVPHSRRPTWSHHSEGDESKGRPVGVEEGGSGADREPDSSSRVRREGVCVGGVGAGEKNTGEVLLVLVIWAFSGKLIMI